MTPHLPDLLDVAIAAVGGVLLAVVLEMAFYPPGGP